MKKAIIFSFMLVLALGLFSCNGKKSKGAGKVFSTTEETTNESTEETASQEAPKKVLGYVDLGLPSGTLWKNANEGGDSTLYTYDEAVSMFGDKLPTAEQFEELINECEWTWTGNGYKVTGSNGNSITLPAAGFSDTNGGVYYVGTDGGYWSSTPDRSSTPDGSGYAWVLYIESGKAEMDGGNHNEGYSVRLVK